MIDIGDGITMTKATRRDILAVERDARKMDAEEIRLAVSAGLSRDSEDAIGETTWTIWHDGERVGYGGFALARHQAELSNERVFFFLSTNHVWKMKKLFVRKTPAVFRAMCAALPRWVDTAIAAPLSRYTGATRWLGKILGFAAIGKVDFGDGTYTIMIKHRKG